MPENYQVRAGDCIASIAFARGFFPETIWNHPDNAALKRQRKDPHVLHEGDQVSILDKRIVDLAKSPEKRHRFRRKGVPQFLRIQLTENDKPVANLGFQITIDGIHSRGTTDGEGWLKQPIAPDAKVARLLFDNGTEYELELGHLDPIDTVRGVKQRLEALRYFAGPIDGQMDADTTAALKAFQLRQNLRVTGESDQETKDALVQIFGG